MFEGTPVKIEFKTSENPFEGRKSQVDERTAARRRRYIQKFKKQKRNLNVNLFLLKKPKVFFGLFIVLSNQVSVRF